MTKTTLRGKLDAGNPHVRLDEGKVAPSATPRRGSLLYNTRTAKAVYAIAAFIGFTMPASAANIDWTLSGGTAEDPLVISENVTLTSSDNLYFKNESLAYVTSGQETTLCASLYCTGANKNSPVVFVGNLLYAGSLTASYGSITKYGDWESTGAGSFMLGQASGTFAFTNETGSISAPAVSGNTDSAVTGRLQLGYGGNGTAIYCQNGGNATFNQLLTGFANGNPGSYAKNSKNHVVINGGNFTITGRANLGCGVNTTWYEQTGGDVSFGEMLYVGKLANSTNYWSQSGGNTKVASTVNIGNAAGAKVSFCHSGGNLTIQNGYLRIGNADSDTSDAYFEISGGTVSNLTSSSRIDIAAEGQLGSRAELKVKGNGVLYHNWLFNVGLKGAGILTIEDDGLVEMPNKSLAVCSGPNVNECPAVGEDSYVNLNGGTLLTQGVRHGIGYGAAYLIFDGGTLKAAATPNTTDGFLPATRLNVLVGDNGGTIDTSLASVTINSAISNKVGCVGGMTFKGGNAATVTGRLSYAGATTVEVGTTLTVADRADVFDTGAGLVCLVSDPSAAETQHTLLTTSGDDAFTAADLAKCSASGYGNVKFTLSGDGKSICAKATKGLIISIY